MGRASAGHHGFTAPHLACAPAGNNGAAPSPSGAAANTAATGADPSQPTTHIQVRMSDGSKLKGTFNLSQTVGDIRK